MVLECECTETPPHCDCDGTCERQAECDVVSVSDDAGKKMMCERCAGNAVREGSHRYDGMRSYTEALAEARKVGAVNAAWDGKLAQVCQALAVVHAVNADMLYRGAATRGLSDRELARLAHEDPGEFAFVMFDAPDEE